MAAQQPYAVVVQLIKGSIIIRNLNLTYSFNTPYVSLSEYLYGILPSTSAVVIGVNEISPLPSSTGMQGNMTK
jgi:hypothetical protein